MKTKLVIIFAIFIVLLIVLGIWLKGEARIDSCLDLGGKWNYDTKECETEMKTEVSD